MRSDDDDDAPTKQPYVMAGMSRDEDDSHVHQQVNHLSSGWLTKRPISTEDRLILNFDGSLCCSLGHGLNADFETLPAVLAQRGVTPYQWGDFMQRLDKQVIPKHWNACVCISCALTGICLPLVCYKEYTFQEATSRWVDDLNSTVLQPNGMYAKFQTNYIYIHYGEGSSYTEEISWLAIAMTPAEVERLKKEPTFWSPACCNDNEMVPNGCEWCFCCCFSRRIV